ncbi:MAG: hypothetical protein FWG14_11615 [Peptococcaceae bacterium]|nr:hypothetical protein [Peptococcaceae bacterium]
MFCKNCGNSIKGAHRFCTRCGAAIEKEISQEAGDQREGSQQEEPQRKKRTKIPIILGSVIILLVLGVGGFFIVRALGVLASPDEISSDIPTPGEEQSQEDDINSSQLIGTFQGDGFTLTYDTVTWKKAKVGGRDGLVHAEDNSALLLRAPNELPQDAVNFANFSIDFLNRSAYTMLQSLIESAVKGEGAQQGYSMTGGSEKFLPLKDGEETYYATMEYKNEEGFVGTAYIIISQKNKFNMVCMTRIEDAKNAKSVDEHVMKVFKSIKYTGS